MAGDHIVQDEETEFFAPGWDSIDEKLAELYPGVEPFHYGTIVKWAMGGPDPLDGVSIFRNPGPPDHWHYVSYGLTELYEKESETKEFSGYGFEFTFRLAVEPGEDEQPPTWPIALMQNLARYVFQTGNVFDYGHRIPLGGPIDKANTLLCGAMFVVDRQLGIAESKNGNYSFLQVIGTTADELDAAEAWNTKKFIDLLSKDNELLVTKIHRKSVLDNPEIAKLVDQGTEKDGSSCGTLYVGDSEIVEEKTAKATQLSFRVLAKDVASVRRLIAGRLLHKRQLTLVSPDSAIVLLPADESNWKEDEEEHGFLINLSPNLVKDILLKLDIGEKRSTFDELKNFVVEIK
jgi:suppressor of fused